MRPIAIYILVISFTCFQINAFSMTEAIGNKAFEEYPQKETTPSRDFLVILDTNVSTGEGLKRKSIHQKCSKPEHIIRNEGDMMQLGDCSTIEGDIVVDGYIDTVLDLGATKDVWGDIKIQNSSNVARVEGFELERIGGSTSFQSLTALSTIRLPRLKTMQSINWQVLPILSSVSFNSEVSSLETIIISDTALTQFTGFHTQSLKVLNINNNRYMELVESDVEEITGELSITSNAKNVQISLPNLKNAKNITVRDAESVDLRNLENVAVSAGFIENSFKELHLPKLQHVGGTFGIMKNERVENLEFPELSEIEGGLIITNNTNIHSINFFPELKSIGGAIRFEGEFADIQLEELEVVKGSALVRTLSETFDCNNWLKLDASSIVRGGVIECFSNKHSQTIHVNEEGKVVKNITDVNSVSSKSNAAKLKCSLFSLFMALLMIPGL
ncbi:BA75_03349T0 [Komagataella pastoris]|uniref:BA75_03349T0 n=1 Tax=Komagataella pastoris TaxID=4922 RepID=A0A1B2JFE1_PICPA|nr:BA75_03349T0 [Komagataella pastoris]